MGEMPRSIESRNVRRSAGKHTSLTLARTLALWLIIVALLQISLVASTTASAHPVPERAVTPEAYFGLIYPGNPDIGDLRPYETQIGKRVSLMLWYEPWQNSGQLQPFPVAQMNAVRED